MRIALVYPDLSRKGGAENVVAWTAAGLARRGHTVAVFTGQADPGLWPSLPELAAQIRPAAPRRRGKRIRRALATGRDLAPQLTAYDAVYAHNRYALLWALPAAARLAWYCQEPSRRLYAPVTDAFLDAALRRSDVDRSHPALVQYRQVLRKISRGPARRLRSWRHRRRERAWVREPQRAFVNSRYSAAAFEAAFGRRPEVLDLGLPAAPNPAPAAGREGIVVVSSRSPKKNLHGVLAAAAELERRGALPDERFHVWGIGSAAPEFREQVAQAGLERRVQLHGFQEEEAAQRRMARARLCLFLPLCEPFGLVVVEALQAGVPVLASDHGGPAEILERCGGGRTVDPLRPDRVADALEAMLGDPAGWERLQAEAAAAGRRARVIHSLERYLERTEKLLAGLAEAGAGGAGER